MSIPGSALALAGIEAAGIAVLESISSQGLQRQIQWTPTSDDGQPVLDQSGQPVVSSLIPQVVVEERHQDDMMITEHPVEQGAEVSDHVFKRPAELTIKAGWTTAGQFLRPGTGIASLPTDALSALLPRQGDPNYLASLYATLLQLQASRSLFTVTTGKRIYPNMALRSLTVNDDYKTASTLMITAACKEVIIVQTRVVTVPPSSVMAQPRRTAPLVNSGTRQTQPAPNYNGASQ